MRPVFVSTPDPTAWGICHAEGPSPPSPSACREGIVSRIGVRETLGDREAVAVKALGLRTVAKLTDQGTQPVVRVGTAARV